MNQIEKTLADVAVQHQRIPINPRNSDHQCSGCDHLRGEPDGPNSPRHAAHVAAEQMKAIAALAQTADPRKHGKTLLLELLQAAATSSMPSELPALAPLHSRIADLRRYAQTSINESDRELYRAIASSLSNDLAEINQNLLPTIPPGPCWNDSGVTWPNGERPCCELLAGHDGAHTWKRPLGGEAVWTDADADSELAQLHRWKQEALPVIAGLQELGRALDLRPGENITGPKAVEAATAMRAELTRLNEDCRIHLMKRLEIEAELTRLREGLEALLEPIELDTDYAEHLEGCEGEDTCPACWAMRSRALLRGLQR